MKVCQKDEITTEFDYVHVLYVRFTRMTFSQNSYGHSCLLLEFNRTYIV